MKKDRKITIADAVLELLAVSGARGLTHRAVDHWADHLRAVHAAYEV